ncbi:DUF58 domain-containing protein [Neobacillus notoginsengisoli]|uniref:DUF58 domain-containing protein n=1 Tax=Neobacillus notoginsengisoli TaxID=1578198 RepID=A0A417YQR7_9BACI|nr:DUF58 domain-containing protein [Neobacillus notoginsengisoli]RHW36434.1 DUF58 domain-containing protein [Neobacillus notoginsengisoli]
MRSGHEMMLGRLHRRKLYVKTRRRGTQKGSRRAGKAGTSLEFSDFRSYQPGDDIRLIDWNIYGRTQKHYIKRFLDEQEIHAAILLDATLSMQALDTKWVRAKEIAAALAYIALNGDDRLTFIPVSASAAGKITRKGTVYAKNVFNSILSVSGSDKPESFTESILKESLKHTQTAILITDGMESLEGFEALFRKLAGLRIEGKLIQVLSREEVFPEKTGDLMLIDSETGQSVNVSMHENVIKLYQKRLDSHNGRLEDLCRKYGFTYITVTDADDLQQFIFHTCTAKKVLE